MRRIAIVMAGGSGERFWPLSRLHRPKQLLNLASPDRTLLAQTVDRLQPTFAAENIFIATAPHLVAPSQSALPELPAGNVQAEPHKRNTAGCLIWVAANLLAQDADARSSVTMAVIAADHRISPDDRFRDTIDTALGVAESTGGIVTIGIPPSRPETGYGYIEADSGRTALGTSLVPVLPVRQFREKPDHSTAEAFLVHGGFYWNSGTFFWTLATFLTELELAAPELYAATMRIAELLRSGDQTMADEAFAALPSISIDYALMEKARTVYVAKAAFDWDDVGAWDALDRSLSPDSAGNVVRGDVHAVESSQSIVINESATMTVCTLGVEGLVVVVTEDAVLVLPKDRAQDVRRVVESVRAQSPEKI
ncbi:MAG: NTP transferase domain-containing protein [Chthonomonas sp.]|nr:NTP transferase domain-containing protein [Chthonomonas sp.]